MVDGDGRAPEMHQSNSLKRISRGETVFDISLFCGSLMVKAFHAGIKHLIKSNFTSFIRAGPSQICKGCRAHTAGMSDDFMNYKEELKSTFYCLINTMQT